MRAVATLLLLMLGACHRHAHDADGHDDVHAHVPSAERPALAFTDWSEQTELFMELPALVKGQDSPCAAHVTTLAAFDPPAAGRVSVVLRGGGGEQRFAADKPTVPGIFRPTAKPNTAGKHALSVEIAVGDVQARHELGEVMVFESVQAALKAMPEEPEPAGRITFLKEQQWPIPFSTAAVTERPLSPTLRVPGRLIARPEADLTIRAPVAGRVLSLEDGFPMIGSAVAVGQTLAVLAPRLEAADVASLELAIQSGELEVRYAESDRKRLESLRQEGAVPERRVIEASHQESSARAALATAQRRLSQFRRIETASGRGQGSLPLLSPLAGVLAEARVAPSAFVQTGAPLFRVLDTTTLWLEARVSELDVASSAGVRGASFAVPGRPTVELGPDKLVARSPTLDARTRTQAVWFSIDNTDHALAIGTLTEVFLSTGEPVRMLAVPESALVDDAGISVVFVQVEGEAFERRVVRTGIRDRGYIAIERGLTSGEHVVTRGAYAVKLAASGGSIPAHGHAH